MTLIIYKESKIVEKNKFMTPSELLHTLSGHGITVSYNEASKMIDMGGSHVFGYENPESMSELARISWNRAEVA